MGDKQALAAVNRLCIIAGRRSVGWGDRDDLLNAADTIDRLTRERDEAYTAGFEAAREEAAKVADSMTGEIKHLHATDYSHVKIGSLTAVSSAIADAIRSLSPSKDEEQAAG